MLCGTMPERALDGVTVVECGITGAAAYGAKLLADLGADVIKVEPPGTGDPARALGPFPGDGPNPDASAAYLYLNTNKQGVTLDIASARGRELLGRLVSKADVFIHDFFPQDADAFGLTYDRVREESSDIVMTSIFPFGSDGPQRDFKAYDLTLLSAGGWTWINGWPGHPEMPPLKPYGYQAAYQGGVNAALATMGALFGRLRGSGGQHIEISVQACIASILESVLATWTYSEIPVMRWGNRPIHPIDMFQCKDGEWIFALCIEEHQWQGLVEVMEAPEWTQWEVSANRFVRASNWDALRPFMEEWVAQWNADDLYRAVQEKRVPFAPVSTMGSLLESDHLKVRGFFVEVSHPNRKSLAHPGAPFRMSETPWEIRSPAPTLGQHNAAVFGEMLGVSDAELSVLTAEGVV
jgi:crotonobetainyl-CoA:carnitine CoA-transferase CaiB-like acyl-CoA transferase